MKFLSESPIKKLPIILLFVLISIQSFSQGFVNYQSGNQGGSLNYQIAPEPEVMEGTPYLNKDWKNGIVYFKNKTSATADKMRYNIFSQDIVFEDKGKVYAVTNKHEIDSFFIGETKFVNKYINSEAEVFFEVLEEGPGLSILKKYYCSIQKGQPSKGYIKGTKDEYIIKDDIFISTPNTYAQELKVRKGKSLLQYIRHDDMVESFIDEENLKMKDIEDLIKVTKFYNSIIEIDKSNK